MSSLALPSDYLGRFLDVNSRIGFQTAFTESSGLRKRNEDESPNGDVYLSYIMLSAVTTDFITQVVVRACMVQIMPITRDKIHTNFPFVPCPSR